MKNKIYSLLFLLLISVTAMKCKKENTLQDELAKLPPSTQTGANTFGCLVNGKAWVAQNQDCFLLCDPSFKMYYDNNRGGYLSIDAVFKNSTAKIDQYIGIGIDSTKHKSSFQYSEFKNHMGFIYSNKYLSNECNSIKSLDNLTVTLGLVAFTEYDLQSGIISWQNLQGFARLRAGKTLKV